MVPLSRGGGTRLIMHGGRGVSPFELGYHKIKHEDSRDIFKEAYACLTAALTSDPFTFESELYQFKDVPMPLRPLQQPTPAMWYASSNETGSMTAVASWKISRMSLLTALYLDMSGAMTIASGQAANALNIGIAERTPKRRAR
jgi:hypothetical protein